MEQQPLVAQDLLIIEASRSYSGTPHSVGLLWTSDQPVVETATWHHTQQTGIHPPAEFEPAIPASERPQTHTLDCAATGIGQPVDERQYLKDGSFLNVVRNK